MYLIETKKKPEKMSIFESGNGAKKLGTWKIDAIFNSENYWLNFKSKQKSATKTGSKRKYKIK